jgi:hypothetical protein
MGSREVPMSIFFVEIENEEIRQSLLLTADDFVSATMQATDFVRKLEEAGNDEFGELGFKINTVNDTDAMWAIDEAIQECLAKIRATQLYKDE